MTDLPGGSCWTRLGLVSRLMLVAALAMLLGGVALLYTTVQSMTDGYKAELREEVSDSLGSLAIVLTEQAVVGDYATIQQILDGRVKRRGFTLISWTDTLGKSIVARDQSVPREAPDWFVRWVGFPSYDGEFTLNVGGQDYGRIFVRMTTMPATNQIWRTFSRQFQIILLGGLLFFGLSALLLKFGLRPLHLLALGAERFGRGDYSARIEACGAQDILPSIHAFNDMAEKIESLLYSLREREEVLKESEAKLHDIASSLGEGVYMLDPKGRLSFVNPEAERLLGWPQAELLGKDAHLMLHRHTDGSAMALEDCPIWKFSLAGRTYRSSDETFVRRDGSTFMVSLVSAPILKNGEVVGSVVSFFDITERKRAEETLRKFSRVLEQSANSVVITDLEGSIEYVNPRFCESTGYSVEEVLGNNPRLLKSGETSPEEYQRLWRTITSGEVWRGELHNKRKDGSMFWESASIAPVRNEHGEITHFVAVKEDITRRKEAEEALWRLNETLEQRVAEEVAINREKDHILIHQSRLAAMGEMIGNIAHQWRQPLNALGLLLSNIEDAHHHDELDREYLDESVGKGRRLIDKMSTTIDDFRNFFKPDREKILFNLAEAVREALSVVENSFRSNHVTVAMKVEQDAAVIGFPNEYAQVVLNLLSNAKDAIHDRHIQNGKVELVISQDAEFAYVTIRDNGGGIPEKVIEKIFDPYFTTREKGTGIGLYMSKMIIESNMKGRIEVHNAGAGAEFRIATPLPGKGAGNA